MTLIDGCENRHNYGPGCRWQKYHEGVSMHREIEAQLIAEGSNAHVETTLCGNPEHPDGAWHPAAFYPITWSQRRRAKRNKRHHGCSCGTTGVPGSREIGIPGQSGMRLHTYPIARP